MKRILLLFLLAILLIKLPSFYLIPFSGSKLFVSHTFAKVMFYLLFPYCFFGAFKKKNIGQFLFILFLFVSQSVTIFVSQDPLLFLKSYQNVVANLAIYVIAASILSDNKEGYSYVANLVKLSVVLCVGLDIFFIFTGKNIVSFLPIQNELYSAYVFNIDRGRYTLNLNSEIFIPFLISYIFLYLNKKKIFLSLLNVLLLATIILLSAISNFRGQFIQGILGTILGVIFIINKKYASIKKLFLLGSVLIVFFGLIVSTNIFGFNIIDRFIPKPKSIDSESIKFRISSAQLSIALFKSSPLLGVGLGGYESYLERPKNKFSNPVLYNDSMDPNNPHNILFQTLAESGILGIFAFIIVLIQFVKIDLIYINDKKIIPFILSSWALFIYLLINPSSSIFFSGWFWFLRGTITAMTSTSLFKEKRLYATQ